MPSLFGFGFGKKRSSRRKSVKRSAKRSSKKVSSKKPPALLLKYCKKLRIKSTTKRGSKRVYKSVKVLKKLCLKKLRALKKKLLKKKMMMKKKKMMKKKSKMAKKSKSKSKRSKRSKTSKRRGSRRMMEFGSCSYQPGMTAFGARRTKYGRNHMEFGRRSGFGLTCPPGQVETGFWPWSKKCKPIPLNRFGKKRSNTRKKSGKVSKAAAMKAFKKFYMRHCRVGGRRHRFGNGGNPPLIESIGSEFCAKGGGVLGATSTGLFPSPCVQMSAADMAKMNAPMGDMGLDYVKDYNKLQAQTGGASAAAQAAFGKKRRSSRRKVVKRRGAKKGKKVVRRRKVVKRKGAKKGKKVVRRSKSRFGVYSGRYAKHSYKPGKETYSSYVRRMEEMGLKP